MAATVTHTLVSAVTDAGVAGEVSPNDWNDSHVISGTFDDAQIPSDITRIPNTTLDNFYVATDGSDSNNGRSWRTALLTPAAAITAANGTGDIHFGPGTFAWADTLTIPQGVRLHGKSPTAAAGGGGGTETIKAVGSTGSTETIALALTDGNVQTFTVDANCTFTMPSGLAAGAKSFTAILTDSGGPRTITFSGVKWSEGVNPTAMSAASAIDIYTFLTINGGTTWYGFTGGTSMAT